MSDGSWKMVFKPLSGTFELERQAPPTAGGTGGGTVTRGTLVFPSGVTLEVTEGMATTGSGEITLAPNSEIVVLA